MVGLGAGSLAWYGTSGQIIYFFEIDPMVARIAANKKLPCLSQGSSWVLRRVVLFQINNQFVVTAGDFNLQIG